MKSFFKILLLLLFITLFLDGEAESNCLEIPRVIRVSLDSIKGKSSYHLITAGDFTAAGKSSLEIKDGTKFILKVDGDNYSIVLGNETIVMGLSVLFSPQSVGGGLLIEDSWFPERLYNGQVLWTYKEGEAFPILYTDLEDYVSGLLLTLTEGAEPLSKETKRAMAALATTFAVSRLADMASEYDVADTAPLWHYNGTDRQNPDATDAEFGSVCLADGRLIPALYTRSNGESTVSAQTLFPGEDMALSVEQAARQADYNTEISKDITERSRIGTGVNLNGAEYLAEQGKKYDEILAFYFEGAECLDWPLQSNIGNHVFLRESFGTYYTVNAPDGTQSSCIVYSDPDENADIIDVLYPGNRVIVYEINQDWVAIRHGLLVGYINNAFITSERNTVVELINESVDVNSSQSVNLRRQPGFQSDILATLRFGEGIHTEGTPVEGWIRSDALGYSGYLQRSYLKEKDVNGDGHQPVFEKGSITDVQEKTGVVTAVHGLNVRVSPQMDSKILTTLPYGTSVRILGEHQDFYKIEWDATEGYVSKGYVVLSEGI